MELTPEKAIDIQFNLGSDIMVVLDDCRHYKDDKELKKSVYRTIEWAKRCKAQFEKNLEHLEDFPSIKINPDAKVKLMDHIEPAAGFGLRIKFDKYSRTNICVDFGIGTHGSKTVFLNIGEIF